MLRRTENIRFADLSEYDYSEGETSEDMRIIGEQQASRNTSSPHLIQTCGFNLDITKQLEHFDYNYPKRSAPFSLPKLRDIDNQFKEFSVSDKFPLSVVDPIDCVVLNCCRPMQFPKISSEYTNDKLPILSWQKITPNADVQNLQSSYKLAFQSIKRQMHFQGCFPPTVEKMSALTSIRHDVPSGRIVFHYIGYGFPQIDSKTIYVCETKTLSFAQYPLKSIFTNIKPPSMFIFDCDNAGAVLDSLKQYSKKLGSTPPSSPRSIGLSTGIYRSVKWDDFYCLCACSEGEKLPSDRRLPRDFLTSAITTPVATAILCHILLSYRTTLGSGEETLQRLQAILHGGGPDKSGIEAVLTSIIDGIASDVLDNNTFVALFRQDRATAILFRHFILAEYLLRPYSVHPVSHPKLPPTSLHHLWQQWRTVCDQWVGMALVPQPALRQDFFARAVTSLMTYIERDRAKDIPNSLLTVACHVPFADVPSGDSVFPLLAEYACKDPAGLSKLSAAVLFQPTVLRLAAMGGKAPDAHSLAFLLLALIDADRSMSAQLRPEYDFARIVDSLFDATIPLTTKALFACFLNRSLSYVKGLRPLLSSKLSISKFSQALKAEDEQYLVSILMLIACTFDSQPADITSLADNPLHAQIGALVGHSSFEVRAAALLALSGLIQGGSAQMDFVGLWFASPGLVDASMQARYSLLIYLIRFLNNYAVRLKWYIEDVKDQMEDGSQSFGDFLGAFIGVPYLSVRDDFKAFSSRVFEAAKKADAEATAVSAAFRFLSLLTFDSCVPIRRRARAAKAFLEKQCSPTNSIIGETDDDAVEDPSSHETSVLREAFFSQTVRAGQWSLKAQMRSSEGPERTRREYGAFDLANSHLQLRAQTTVEGRPTHLAFSPKSLSAAVSVEGGRVLAFDENFAQQSSLSLGSEATALMSVCVGGDSHVVALAKDGTAHIWAPLHSDEATAWHVDMGAAEEGDTVGCIASGPSLFCSRGTHAVSRWDLETQRLVGEWSFGDRRSQLTALAVSPQNENLILAGYRNGTVKVFDAREGQDKPLILGLDGSVLHIAPGGDGLLYIGAENGHVLVWDESTNVIITCGDEAWHRMSQFGVHRKHPFFVMSGPGEFPVVTNKRAEVVHTFEAPVARGSIFAIHEEFPVIAFASDAGDLLSFNLLQ